MHDIEIDDEELGKGSSLTFLLKDSVKRDLWLGQNWPQLKYIEQSFLELIAVPRDG